MSFRFFERMMREIPRSYPPERVMPPLDSPCYGCHYWRDMPCGACHKKIKATSGQNVPKSQDRGGSR